MRTESRADHGCNHLRRRGGFAMIMAIALLAVVGVATAGLVTTFATDARRARDEAAAAQLRQLVTAGALEAWSMLADGKRLVELPLPTSVHDGRVSVAVTPDGDVAECRVDARLEGRAAHETFRFARTGAAWHIVGVAP